MQKLNLTLALAAGLLGGIVSRVALPVVNAQNPAPREVRATRFVVVDGTDNAIGTFTIGLSRRTGEGPLVVLPDSFGQEVWRGDEGVTIRPLSENLK